MRNLLLIIFFLFIPLILFADNEEETQHDPLQANNRTVEIGFLKTRIGFSNNYLKFNSIFKERIEINLNKLDAGLKFNFDLGIIPLYFSYNYDDLWGLGFSYGVDTKGNIDISGNLLTLGSAVSEASQINAAIFTQAKFSSFFIYNDIKIKINPSIFYPVLYIGGEPAVLYSMNNIASSMAVELKYQILVYTAFDTNKDKLKLTASPGVDFHLGAEYQLPEKPNMLVGLDIINLPLIPSSMKHFMKMTGQIGDGIPLTYENIADMVFDIEDPVYGNKKRYILRPFKLLTWLEWEPYEEVPFILTPTLGFALNPLFHNYFSLEIGVKALYNLNNIFKPSLSIGYHDRLWKNNLDMALIINYFEFNFGLDMYAHNFLKSFQGYGLGINIGFKISY